MNFPILIIWRSPLYFLGTSSETQQAGFLMPRLNCDDSLNIMTEVKVIFTADFQPEHSRKQVHVLKESLKEIVEKKARMKEIFQMLQQ